MLTQHDISRFQALYKEHFGKEISAEEAERQGRQLLNLMQKVYKPMTIEELWEVEQQRVMTKKDLQSRIAKGKTDENDVK